MTDKEHSVQQFLNLANRAGRGKFKIYIGMSAGVGKTYRMLQEAHAMLRNGVNIQIGYIETHGRAETHALLDGLPQIPRRQVFYKGKMLEEMDLSTILLLAPDWVVVDELAHSNIPGSKNEKRWQDVVDLLNAGINVISAVNIQHIESINQEVKSITGVEVQERVPDLILQMADEVVNIDLTADELITRLKEGKIYDRSKVESALSNFFQADKILQLRELALKEVTTQVERKVEIQIPRNLQMRHESFLACISTNDEVARKVIRKTARLAAYYHADWFVLYVQTPGESADKIALAAQRHLINNLKLATELGAEVIQEHNAKVSEAIINIALEKHVTTICMGKPHISLFRIILRTNLFNQLLKTLSSNDIDIIILS
ncbi:MULTISPECIES: sensor protein KdpD [Chitinophaga]|uniref:sensor protein KdpD n=1 Tax=Chitinophaga TaxID=79328 RepID=UPI000DB9515F|nr:sensor protein KdpD [Chitinophaga ginsengisegetis]MDR6566045.1 two-component system sensor histidine kinase KdpD [Chitinophaga ginsengisegetis]MDR6645774.1 two-component system sensor histidine kinase KdpD [Chitinophaga ginsengisegetis]MDR6651634.1 two-component system sensor histidine kinase KdpD [Chitinophaga ginsengisegetis]